MRKSKWIFLFIFLGIQIQEKGCKNEEIPSNKIEFKYDYFILDMPHNRDLYTKLNIKERKMLEVKTIDLPAEKENIVRVDSFDTFGKVLKVKYFYHTFLDSLKYDYTELGEVEKKYVFSTQTESDITQFYYDDRGMMKQLIVYRDETLAYDIFHTTFWKLTDQLGAVESPTPVPARYIYKYDSFGRLKQKTTIVKGNITEKELRFYDGKNRLVRQEYYHQGVLKSTTHFSYNANGLLSIQKNKTRLAKEEWQEKVYEFVYVSY